jgi:hypothetical protein
MIAPLIVITAIVIGLALLFGGDSSGSGRRGGSVVHQRPPRIPKSSEQGKG